LKHALLVIAGIAIVLSQSPRATGPASASTAAPANFVYRQSCPAPFASPSVGFAIPGTRDLPSLAVEGAEQIWIDLSIFDNGFAAGTFIGAGPFIPRHGALEFQWDGIDKSYLHHYRLNALRDGSWFELGRATFQPINCGVVEGMECQIGHPEGLLGVQFGISEAYSPPGRPAIEQWFDLTLFANPRSPTLDNGFLPGTFIGAGPFPPTGTHLWWSGIKPGLHHFYRKNVLHAGTGWEQTYSGSFVSLDCRGLPAFDPPG
jgi:hypothetical protein